MLSLESRGQQYGNHLIRRPIALELVILYPPFFFSEKNLEAFSLESLLIVPSTVLSRLITRQRDPMHTPFKPMIIIDRIMQRRSILHNLSAHLPIANDAQKTHIPKRNTARLPPKPARKLRLHLMLKQKPQQRRTLLRCPAIKPLCMRHIHV